MTLTKRRLLGRDVNMTEGSIVACILKFALPLLLGNLFQQLYNMVDTWVIGQTGQNGAYAAVGSVGPIINILIGFFSGLATGAGVVISQYYGAKKMDKVSEATHTAVAMTAILAVVISLIGVLTTPLLLRLMLKDEGTEVFAAAQNYLTIYFAGAAGLMFYNMGAGILRAVGDSSRPFYFLVVAAILNTLLDLLFVFGLGMEERGVALATVIAQLVSAALTFAVLLRTSLPVRVSLRRIRIHRGIIGRVIRIGIPSALQMALTAFSNVFVQSYIAGANGVQEINLAGWTSYSKIDQFIFLPVQSLALAVTTFVGQNIGIGDHARAKRGIRLTYAVATGITVVVIATVMIFAAPLARLFNSDPAVVEVATLLLHYITPFYLCTCVNQIFSAALRGAGNSGAPMIIMLTTFVGFRQLYLFLMTTFVSNDLIAVGMGYPAGWVACATCTLIYFLHFNFDRVDVFAKKKPKIPD